MDEQNRTLWERIECIYEYDGFGNIIDCEEKIRNIYQFAGEQYDPLTNQYYLKARYYNPVIGRFNQMDTYHGDGLNLYIYVGNNPVRYVDPSGHCKKCESGTYSDTIKWGIHDIEVRPEGNGFWGRRIKQSDPRVDAYELKINPNNESYYLPHPNGGYVQFENMVNCTVQDGKLIMKQKSFYHVEDMPDFAKNKVLQEAQRQVDSATFAGYKVEWLVSDESAVKQLENLFKNNNMDIKIKYYPE